MAQHAILRFEKHKGNPARPLEAHHERQKEQYASNPEYTPHADCGDYVIVINAEKAVLTGKKLDQKFYRTHSGWVGGLKEVKYRTLMQSKPELAMKLAVRGMMPRNVITKDSLSRLHIYRGGEHEHAAQKPEVWAAE